jgi:ClpP class serine protease
MPQPESFTAAIPYAAELLGAWAMTEKAVNAQLAIASRLNLHTHLAGPSAVALRSRGERSYPYDVQRGVAVIELGGTLMKHEASMTRSTSTVMARRTLLAAVADPAVKGIVLAIDSPGGTVAGTADLPDKVFQANQQKPVVTLGEDLVGVPPITSGHRRGSSTRRVRPSSARLASTPCSTTSPPWRGWRE